MASSPDLETVQLVLSGSAGLDRTMIFAACSHNLSIVMPAPIPWYGSFFFALVGSRLNDQPRLACRAISWSAMSFRSLPTIRG
jgi:hypothetical protein